MYIHSIIVTSDRSKLFFQKMAPVVFNFFKHQVRIKALSILRKIPVTGTCSNQIYLFM